MTTHNEPEFNIKAAIESAEKAWRLAEVYNLEADIGSQTDRESSQHYTILAMEAAVVAVDAVSEYALSQVFSQIDDGIAQLLEDEGQ